MLRRARGRDAARVIANRPRGRGRVRAAMPESGDVPGLPAGTVTFLLTEADGAAGLVEAAGQAAEAAIERHLRLITDAVAAHGGAMSPGQPAGVDGAVAVFASAGAAVAAALDAQLGLAAEPWPDGVEVRARMGLHSGEARLRADRRYGGAAVLRCARLRDAGHGGQILLTAVTAALAADVLPPGGWLADLGEHRLRDLARPERVYALRHPGLAADLPPLVSLDVLPNNLPTQLTSFVGRDRELDEISDLLRSAALVTLTGSGGCGKTRLAVQAAAELADHWPDGVWWIDLQSVGDPAAVPDLVAATMPLDGTAAGNASYALRRQLRDRRVLICLDNCEHVLDGCAQLTDALLRSCPRVSVLATSREPLGVAGETVWRVPSLGEDEAVRLFADRAARVRPGFAVDAGNEAAVRTVCRRLDGIPLAVELAAPWVRALTPAQIADGLDDRFRLLTGGPRGVMARQRTLAASIEWSHDLLDKSERVALRRLSVFAGAFGLDAATAVCAADPLPAGDVLGLLGRLVDKSLVLADDGDAGGGRRYRLLETVREFGGDQLRAAGEAAETRDRHLDHYLGAVERAEPELERDQDRWRAALEADHDNVRAALRWGLSLPDPLRGRRLAAAMARLWFVHGHAADGSATLAQAIDRDPEDRSDLQGRLWCGQALLALGTGRPGRTAEAAERALAIAVAAGDDRTHARALVLGAFLAFFTDFAACQQRCRKAREPALASGDPFALAFGTIMEACSLTNRDRHAEAAALARPVFDRALARGDRFCAAVARACEVWEALFCGDLRRAEVLAAESLHVARPVGDSFAVGVVAANAAWVHGLRGDIDAGQRLMEPIVRSIEDAGTDLELIPWLTLVSGKLSLWAGDLDVAHRRLAHATRFAEPRTDNWITARALPDLATTLRLLGRRDEAEAQADRAVALARSLGVPHILADGLAELAVLAEADDPERAEDLHHRALAVRVEHGLRTFVVDSLEALARLAVRSDSPAEAARLLAASGAARGRIGYLPPPVHRTVHDEALTALRDALDDERHAQVWAEGAQLDLDEAVAYATRARGARGRPSTGWASLTPTELDVVRLAVDGRTNGEIGARLFMSRSTVKTHLAHVYAKLGVANRTELATSAAERAKRPALDPRR